MNIVVCGSLAFYDRMRSVRDELEALGHEVTIPDDRVDGPSGSSLDVDEWYVLKKRSFAKRQWMWERKEQAMRDYLEHVTRSDAVLVLNYAKNGIDGYVGPNTLIEMGVAFHERKPIFLLNAIPTLAYTEELIGMRPILLDGELAQLPARPELDRAA
jgi:nucleoside 2-deoxyribosyltransferase